MDSPKNKERSLIYATLPVIGLGLANGLYMESLYQLQPVWFWLADFFQFVFVPVFTLFLLWRISGWSPHHYGFRKMNLAEFVGAALISTVIFLVLYEPVVNALARIFDINSADFGYQSTMPKDDALRFMVVIYFSITAAVVEETVFRALPWAYFSRTDHSRYAMLRYALISSILFGLIHWENGPHEVFATFLLGLAACVIYAKINNIWPLVCAHFFTDISSFWWP